MERFLDRGVILRHQADALIERARRETAQPCRSKLLRLARKLNQAADRLEMDAAKYVANH
jgi:hypothetical protein